jgi:hypothetical protein
VLLFICLVVVCFWCLFACSGVLTPSAGSCRVIPPCSDSNPLAGTASDYSALHLFYFLMNEPFALIPFYGFTLKYNYQNKTATGINP